MSAILSTSAEADQPTPVQKYFWRPRQKHERTQLRQFLKVDMAHLTMLEETRILARDVAGKILAVLQEINNEGVDRLIIDPCKESLLFNIEDTLKRELGLDVAGCLHTARSRIDQSATVARLEIREKFLDVMGKLLALQDAVLTRATEFPNALMPYYTHMQQAQPGVLGHYLVAQVQKLQDDYARCQGAFDRLNRNPLGIVGRSGTSWSIDRQRTTELMGFDGIIDNSLTGRDTDYAAEILAYLGLLMSHLNDWATDFHIWFTAEFGFIDLPKEFCCASSIFPQKKNPVTLEQIKTVSGEAVGWFGTTCATFRGAGTGDQIPHGVHDHFGTAMQATSDMLDLAVEIINNFTFKADRAKQVLCEGWSTASNLADVLVRKHEISPREAHKIVQALKTYCDEQRKGPSDVTPELFKAACTRAGKKVINISQEGLDMGLDPEQFVRNCVSTGSVAPTEITRMIDQMAGNILRNKAWLNGKRKQMKAAEEALEEAVHGIIGPDQRPSSP
jgi:argininosuccinate lyase